jgi:hypothetical protein
MKPRRITWLDSRGGGHWITRKRARRDRPVVVESVGWIVKKRKRSIVVASTIADDDNQLSPVTIPRGCIVRMRKF